MSEPALFDSISDAVRWADNFLSRPNFKSQIGEIMKGKVQQNRLGRRSEVFAQDVAIKISTALAAVPAPEGPTYRIIHGQGHSHRMEVADRLAHMVWDGPQGGKTIAEMRDVALLIVERVKRWERSGRKLTYAAIADELGMSRKTYYQKYAKHAQEMTDILYRWISKAEFGVWPSLHDAKIV